MLDTNICIFAMKKNGAVISRFVAEQPSGVAISAITEAELRFGVENSANPAKNAQTLHAFLAAVETLPFDTLAAAEYGRVRYKLNRAGTPIGERDMLIAAHAKAEGLTIATNNLREFMRVEGLATEDWT
jgi:tRNA(fMet)-specific endonuclease VapC